MGFTSSSTSQANAEKIVKIKGLTKSDLNPHFEVQGLQEKATKFTGSIIAVELGEYEFEGKPRDVFKLHMIDDQDEKYLLSVSFTQLSRGLLNTLAGMDNYANIEMSLYTKTNTGKDGKEYTNPRISVWQKGQMCTWKYGIDEQPKPELIKNSKGEVLQNDYSLVDDFRKEKVADISKIAENTLNVLLDMADAN